VRRPTKNTSLYAQLLGLSCGCAVLAASAGLCLTLAHSAAATTWFWNALAALLLVAAVTLFLIMLKLSGRVIRSLQTVHEQIAAVIAGETPAELPVCAPEGELGELHQSLKEMVEKLTGSQKNLADRTKTVDRLLEFSQTIQGAGRIDQIFPTLCSFVESELGLAGATILSHETEPTPCTQVRASCPGGVLNGPVAEFEAALCPCLRQSQPRVFRAGDSPVRCTIDQYLTLPHSHEGYCIPFNVGTKQQMVMHMLLPVGQVWTEQRRQLAQTYANTAQSSLTSLHLLAEAEKQSMTDALTGLYNRRSLDQLLQREVALAERHKQPLSLVMIDMDYFKQVNDSHGHAAGDHMLRSFADCVRMTLRKTDLAFRYGGDEFMIALPQTPIAQAQQVVQKLRQAFAAVDFSSAIAHLEQQPTLSIGVAERSAANNLLTLPALLNAVDQALYEAKASSRNCVQVYQPPKAA
jgi:diguanylate cyclase (GGDEF)-like protein